jgi:hypothetical protein
VAATDEWFWEGNVVQRVVDFLQSTGWTISAVADTAKRSKGHDIVALMDREVLLVEAKGYPCAYYRDPARAAEQKRTKPSLQSKHWYAQALLKAIQLRSQNPEARVALALPDAPTYRALLAQTMIALEKLRIDVLVVAESGLVSFQSPPEPALAAVSGQSGANPLG